MRAAIVLVVFAGCGEPSAELSMNLWLADEEPALMPLSSQSVVSAGASGLKSLKYFISEIAICESFVLNNGSAANAAGCLTLYRGPRDLTLENLTRGSADPIAAADYARAHDEGFIDLVDARARAKLTSPVKITAADARIYNVGTVSWHLPAKVTAELAAPGDSAPRLFTHDGTSSLLTTTVDKVAQTRSDKLLSEGPAEEAVVTFPNGGTWFAFQAPFTITAADIAAGAHLVLDLSFNPQGLVSGRTTPMEGSAFDVLSDGAGNGVSLPFLDLTPVPHKRCERAMKESYRGVVATQQNSFDLRIELHYLERDPQKTVYGVSAAAIANPGTTRAVGMGKVAYVKTNADGSIDFQDWSKFTFLQGLVRRSTVGETSSITLDCHAQSSCPDKSLENQVLPVALTLTGVTTLEAGADCDCVKSSDCKQANQVCYAGVCTSCGGDGTAGAACASGQSCCNAACIDTQTDAMNCGACGARCAAGKVCVAGKCQCGPQGCPCTSSAECADPNQICSGGACVACSTALSGQKCKSGLTCCAGACVDTWSSSSNCGACGARCSPLPNGTPAFCSYGYCMLSCDSGKADCDRDRSNGCEIYLSSDTNCGACGRVCPSGTSCRFFDREYRCLYTTGGGCWNNVQCADGQCVGGRCN